MLTRSNAQARDLQAALRTYGVAAVLQSEESVFAADEAGELERVMRAMAEPDHPARLHAALATTLLSTSSDDLHGLLEEDSAAWEAWSTRFRVCRRRWAERGFVQSLREARVSVRGARVTVIGAGGAARAVVAGLAEVGAMFSMFDALGRNGRR